ncbi:MAG: DNA-formamidopyrimidine glycosylase family protein [Actinomycetota bacterium]
MPELPEVEIMVRRLTSALSGCEVASLVVRGMGTLKSFDPPLEALVGRRVAGVTRRAKLLIVGFSDARGGEGLSLIVHLMSAGRLQVWDSPASMRDKTLRLGIRLTGGRELRLREFGTRQAAWAKLVPTAELALEPMLATSGPEAWPDPPELKGLLDDARPLHSILRDQRVLAGIGRSWADEILHTAGLSPFKRASTLTPEEAEVLRAAVIARLGAALEHYEAVVGATVPDKLPMPLTVHGREGTPCPLCGEDLRAVYFEDYVIAYCPRCQTGGKLLKDRRLSRLVK